MVSATKVSLKTRLGGIPALLDLNKRLIFWLMEMETRPLVGQEINSTIPNILDKLFFKFHLYI